MADPRGNVPTHRWVQQVFANNCMEMKEIELRGGVPSAPPPLDPLMPLMHAIILS